MTWSGNSRFGLNNRRVVKLGSRADYVTMAMSKVMLTTSVRTNERLDGP
jgi:hypothetical protein